MDVCLTRLSVNSRSCTATLAKHLSISLQVPSSQSNDLFCWLEMEKRRRSRTPSTRGGRPRCWTPPSRSAPAPTGSWRPSTTSAWRARRLFAAATARLVSRKLSKDALSSRVGSLSVLAPDWSGAPEFFRTAKAGLFSWCLGIQLPYNLHNTERKVIICHFRRLYEIRERLSVLCQLT